MASPPSAPLTRSVERAADILMALAEGPDHMGVTALSRKLGLGKGTVHRLLQTLQMTGLVSYLPETQTYALGGRVLQLGLSVQERLPIRLETRPFLHDLRDLTGETATLYLPIKHQAVAIEQAVSLQEPKRIPNLGDPVPLHSGAFGKVLLAHHPDEFIDDYLATVTLRRSTERTVTDEAAFREDLELTRRRGYAISIEELRPGTNGVALPLLNASGEVLGAIAVAGPSRRWSEAAITDHLPRIQAIVESLNNRIRYMTPVLLG